MYVWKAAPILGIVAITGVLAAARCTTAESPRQAEPATGSADQLAREGPAGRHAIDAAHLRELMAELDYLAGSRLPEELNAETKRKEQLAEIGDAAEALAGTAEHIPEVLDEVRMAPDDQKYFRELAARLRSEALTLKERAAQGDTKSAKDALARITTTCDTCHKAFRVLPSADRAQH